MRRGLGHARSIAAIASSVLLCALAGQASADSAGTVHFIRPADSSFDPFTTSPAPETQAWIRAHMWRMLAWSPHFDSANAWYPAGWVYDDAYAIYSGSALAAQHPEWILRDSSGSKLFIPYGCSGGSCPQYAADLSNPAFRRYWIEQARAELAHGYRGLYVDDVNMEERVGNGAEAPLAPVGPGGAAITAAAWRAYMAQFMAEIRAACPGVEIAHNALWFANGDAGVSDPSIRTELESANFILLERGVNDAGLTGGSGPWSLNALFAFVDQVHGLGRSVVMDGSAGDAQGMEYNLASYFLISSGTDAVGAKGQTPTSWWQGFDANLGEAIDARHAWSGVLRRDFTGGIALVNPPGSPTQTVALPSAMQDSNGNWVSTVTLAPATGAVLRGTPGPAPASSQAAPAATQTILEAAVIRTRHSGHGGRRAHTHGRGHARRRAARLRSRRAHAASARGGRARARGALLTRLTGVVRRATRGSVVIGIDVRSRGRWIALKRIAVRVSAAGRFITLLQLRAAARYRVCATYTGAAGYRPSWSGYRLLVLRAR